MNLYNFYWILFKKNSYHDRNYNRSAWCLVMSLNISFLEGANRKRNSTAWDNEGKNN